MVIDVSLTLCYYKHEVIGMTSLQIKYFLAVSEHMSFTRAAQKLFVSQPAVSKQIGMLEKELEISLFSRSRKAGLTLTKAGELYLELFKNFTSEFKSTTILARELSESKPRPLKIGIVEGWVLPEKIMNLFYNFKSVSGVTRIDFRAYPFSHLYDKLLSGELDMVITLRQYDLENETGLNKIHLVDIKGVFLFSSKHKKSGTEYEFSDFKDDCMYLLDATESPPIDNTRLLPYLGFDPIVSMMPNRDSILLAISGGEGFAFFDEWTRYSSYKDFTYIYSGTTAETYLFWQQNNPSANSLADHIVSMLK